MAGTTLDRVARSVSANSTRRGAMRLLTGPALGGVLGINWGSAALADKRNKKRKKSRRTCPTCPTCPDCPTCQTCPEGCITGTEPCGGQCLPVCGSGKVRDAGTCGCFPCQPIGASVNNACGGVRCCSGTCGCVGFGNCLCRKPNCVPLGAVCQSGVDCCVGVCVNGNPKTCG